jgi:hypothetical protein
VLNLLKRVVSGVMPAADGGPPMAMRHARTRLLWLLGAGVGLAVGGVVGLLVALAWQALPDVPLLLLGLMAGVPLGVALAVVVGSSLGAVRRRGGLAYLMTPLIVAAAPLLLLGAAWVAIRGRKRTS